MKYTMIKSVLVLLVMLYIPNALAGSILYSAFVTAENAGVIDQTNITAPSYNACEIQKANAINNYLATGYTILNSSNCVPISLRLPELIHPEWHPRWPIPPVCLSCPPWDLGVLEVLDPYLAEQVHELSQKYGIEVYLKELHSLQNKFDLEGFDKALGELDTQQQFK